MNLTYVIADMHGRHDLYLGALALIRDHATGKPQGNRTLIVLGDFVDRGLRSAELISVLRERAWPNWEKIVLQGNHEAMMLECLARIEKIDWWLGNGGHATLWSYGARDGMLYSDVFQKVPSGDIEWMTTLPRWHIDKHRLYVHAGVNPQLAMEEQSEQVLQWLIWQEGANVDYFGRHIVHGHEQNAAHPLLLKNRTNLDSFAWHTGRLAIGVFDDNTPGGPVECLSVSGDKYDDHFKKVRGIA